MGIARAQDEESERREFEDFRKTLVALAAVERGKENDDFNGLMSSHIADLDLQQDKLVCVTSGVSFFGLALVNRLLLRGYSVRILVDNQGNHSIVQNSLESDKVRKPLSDIRSLSVSRRLLYLVDSLGLIKKNCRRCREAEGDASFRGDDDDL